MNNTELLRLAKNVIRNESKWVSNAGKMLDDEFIKAVELIYNSKGHIVITGMGKSGDIGKKIASTFSSIGIFSYFLHNIVFMLFKQLHIRPIFQFAIFQLIQELSLLRKLNNKIE